eukprot:Skav236685  [mRNA]  locus=scaffold847:75251:78950:- [translate_table: standard]
MHEMRTLSTLRHPDLVLFLGASLDGDTSFFLTEYMEGGDVENYMRNQRKKTGKDDFKPPFNVACSGASPWQEHWPSFMAAQDPLFTVISSH